jgi:DNA-directed RNA polymerase subunit RPC12/RpoP
VMNGYPPQGPQGYADPYGMAPPQAAAAMPPPSAPEGPRKLFREPAQTEAVQCPACGGPITLRGFGAIEQVACPYCGSELQPQDSGALQLLQAVQRQRQASVLPLNARGTLEGNEWEIIGIVWRQCVVDGITYPWQEFLLYNPYRGYRWLIYQMTDGHWGLGQALPGAPQTLARSHKTVAFKQETFKHFQTSLAQVVYVEGEFPWQVHRGDHAVAHDYVAPPYGLSIEQQTTEDGGTDVSFTRMEHIEPAAVWKAFGQRGSPPSTRGVGTYQPNPWQAGSKLLWASFLVLLLVWIGASFLYMQGRSNKVVFEKHDLSLEPFSQEIEIGKSGEKTTLELELSAQPLSNSWAYADVMLISQATEEAIGIGATVEEWHGTDGGESWREGDTSTSVAVGGVPGGKYLLQIVPQSGTEPVAGAPPPGQKPPAPLKLSVRLRQDVALWRYILLPLLVILAFPFLNFMLGRVFEGRRWAKSDYAPSSES